MKSNYPDYEGYEDLTRFTPEQLKDYRQMLLEKTKPQVAFIEKHLFPQYAEEPQHGHAVPRGLRVLEVGSGNGRLLIGLRNAGILESGLGLDISESRTIFALHWRNTLGVSFSDIDFYDVDVLEEIRSQEAGVLSYEGYDVAVCITGCIQYFHPIDPEAPMKVLKFMRKAATYSLFELYKKPVMGRTWRKLPSGDPWKYLLDEYEDVGSHVRHSKRFIGSSVPHSEYKEDTKTEYLKYYSMQEFLNLLRAAGFRSVHWAKESKESMVILVS